MDIRHPPNTLHDNHHVGFVHVHLNVVLEDNTHMQVHACMHNKQDVFFFQFCQVCELAIVHNINEPNLARCQEENYNFFRTFSFFFFLPSCKNSPKNKTMVTTILMDGLFTYMYISYLEIHNHISMYMRWACIFGCVKSTIKLHSWWH
jgi:hypothetical protein